MPRNKNINGEIVPFTEEEETIRDTKEAEMAIEIQARKDAETQVGVDKASGNTKLLGLGLTQAEATAMTGFTPE